MSNFASRLREARLTAGLTQEELGFALEVTKSSVSAWETGRETPSFRVLEQLSLQLNVSLDHLVHGHGSEAAEPPSQYEPSRFAQDIPEFRLLKLYRALTPTKRKALLALIDAN